MAEKTLEILKSTRPGTQTAALDATLLRPEVGAEAVMVAAGDSRQTKADAPAPIADTKDVSGMVASDADAPRTLDLKAAPATDGHNPAPTTKIADATPAQALPEHQGFNFEPAAEMETLAPFKDVTATSGDAGLLRSAELLQAEPVAGRGGTGDLVFGGGAMEGPTDSIGSGNLYELMDHLNAEGAHWNFTGEEDGTPFVVLSYAFPQTLSHVPDYFQDSVDDFWHTNLFGEQVLNFVPFGAAQQAATVDAL
ncbi:MAG: hypothetical protein VX871_01805, partial [Pseudomonadota bacterium]|nr:hypothetical protein [Pseudomonadota bacterium]